MKGLAAFIRSVIPADPAQLLFLAGVVCLMIAPHLRWWPDGVVIAPERLATSFGQQAQLFGVFFLYPAIFAGVTGLFICLRPGSPPVRRIALLVGLPAIAGLGLMFSRFVYLAAPSASVLERTSSAVAHKASWGFSMLRNLPMGILVSFLGLVLIAIFTSRLALGIAHLPLSLPGSPSTDPEDTKSWRSLQFLIWILVGPLFLLHRLFAFLTMGLPFILLSRLPAYIQNVWFSELSAVLETLFVFAILFWIMEKENRQVLWNAARLPEPRYVALGFVFPIGIAVLLSAGHYLLDRALWAAHDFGRFAPPQFNSYFNLPDPWLLFLVFPALFEESIFRGLLQRRFIQRYGIYRGIFLVGIVWAAFHFTSDFSSRFTGTDVLLKMGWRILFCLAFSYVLGWLTLRFGSILPPAAAHTFYNVLVLSGFGPPFLGKSTVLVALWSVLAWVLFRYWPVRTEDDPASAPSAVNPEPAV